MDTKLIEALLIEREGYVRRNLPERIKAVDEALRNAGYTKTSTPVETATAEPVVEKASMPATKKRGIK